MHLFIVFLRYMLVQWSYVSDVVLFVRMCVVILGFLLSYLQLQLGRQTQKGELIINNRQMD